jgi:hypothetical protein
LSHSISLFFVKGFLGDKIYQTIFLGWL